jgi:hypothetical protein
MERDLGIEKRAVTLEGEGHAAVIVADSSDRRE